MSETRFDAGAHVDTVARGLGLTIRPEWRDGVVAHAAAIARAADLVMDFALDETIEPAPVFEAGR